MQCTFLFCSKGFAKGKINLVGEGPEHCTNPRMIMEKAKINLTQMIQRVRVQFDNDEKDFVYPNNQSFWKYSEILTFGTYGSCYTFFIPESERKPMPIDNFKFDMKSNVAWMVHSLGAINRKEAYLYNISDYANQKYKLSYEVYQMLDYANKPCIKELDHDRDNCTDDMVFEETMKKLNCTWPFLKNKIHICTDQDSVTKAWEMSKDLLRGSTCASACNYLKAVSIPLRQRKGPFNSIVFSFPESIRVHSAYYAYDELSLIAEIGGYVGLFLGWSFAQILDVIEFLVESLKRKCSK